MNGVIIINKECGMTSHDVVAEVRKILRMRTVGHTGTLDPDATGVLPVCVGRATKLSQFFLSSDKEYEATLVFGVRTDTQDSTGNVVSEVREMNFVKKEVEEAFSKLTGEIEQVPPMVSAVRHKGRRLYELARKGEEVERAPRKIQIFKLEIINCQLPRVRFRVVCSKGTYIRTLCADTGDMLGCGAHQAELTRVRSGPFRLSDSVTLKELRELDNPEEKIIPPDAALSHLPSVKVKDWFGEIMKKNTLISSVSIAGLPESLKAGEPVRINNSREELLGVGLMEANAGIRVAWIHNKGKGVG